MAANTIILLEDDKPLRELYALALAEAGYDVIEDQNSKEILSLIVAHAPALIITDLVMPDHEGVEAIFGPLKQCDVPIIAISAFDQYLDIVKPFVNKVLLKPIQLDVLVAEVNLLIS